MLSTNSLSNLDVNFAGFENHSTWQGYTLVMRRPEVARKLTEKKVADAKGLIGVKKQQDNALGLKYKTDFKTLEPLTEREPKRMIDVWRKIKVYPEEVRIEKEFEWEYKPNSRVYISANSEAMIEFQNKKCNVFEIKENQVNHWDEFEYPTGFEVDTPIYFSPSFKYHLRFEIKKQTQLNKNKKTHVEYVIKLYGPEDRSDFEEDRPQMRARIIEKQGFHLPTWD